MKETFSQTLVKEVRAKFKRPTVIRALLGLPKTNSNDSSVGGVIRGERTLPKRWVGRFAELTDRDPIEALKRYEMEEKPTSYAHDEIQAALDLYPLHRSKTLNLNI